MSPKPPAIALRDLPDEALIRERQLLPMLPFSAPTLWRRVRDSKFPQPIRLTDSRVTCWRMGEVRAWLLSQGDQEAA